MMVAADVEADRLTEAVAAYLRGRGINAGTFRAAAIHTAPYKSVKLIDCWYGSDNWSVSCTVSIKGGYISVAEAKFPLCDPDCFDKLVDHIKTRGGRR